MKQKIFIIEDDPVDYNNVIQYLDLNKYDIIPWYIDKNNNGFQEMRDAINNYEIKDYVRHVIQSNYFLIRVVICDLRLGSDEYPVDGSEIIRMIRNDIELDTLKLYPTLVPIISYTNYQDQTIAQEAILNGATHNISKNNPVYFKEIIDNACTYFKKSYVDREINLFENLFDQGKQLLIDNHKIVTGKIDNVEIIFRGQHDESISKIDLIFKFVFENIDKEKRRHMYNVFKDDLENTFESSNFNNIDESIWDSITREFSKMNSSGTFKEFVDSVYNILCESGMLGTKEKIVGSALKGVFAVMSTVK